MRCEEQRRGSFRRVSPYKTSLSLLSLLDEHAELKIAVGTVLRENRSMTMGNRDVSVH